MDWDAAYERGETPWDKGACAPELGWVLREGLLKGRVFVPGCGLGHDARAIAQATGEEVVGLDVAPLAVQRAQALGGPGGLQFECGDLFQLGEVWERRFEWVWEHTCFCAIAPERRPAYVEAVRRVLRQGGAVLGVFFLNPQMDAGESGPPFGVSLAELEDCFVREGRFALERAWAPRAAYVGREGREWVCLFRKV